MVSLPPRHRIRNFSDELEASWLFRSEGLALQSLFANPLMHTLGAEQVKLPEIGHLGLLKRSEVAGIGWIGGQSLEMRIGASFQTLFQYYQWHKKLLKGEDLQKAEMPVFSQIATDVGSRKRGMTDDAMDQLRFEDDEARPSHADDLAKQMYKALLLELGTLHVLLHEEGAKDAVSEIRLRHSHRHMQEIQSPGLRKLFIKEPVVENELQEVQKRVDTIYANLQKALCTAIPDAAMYDAIEHPLSSPLAANSLEQIRQLYFHMYSANGQEQSFADRFLNIKSGPDKHHR